MKLGTVKHNGIISVFGKGKKYAIQFDKFTNLYGMQINSKKTGDYFTSIYGVMPYLEFMAGEVKWRPSNTDIIVSDMYFSVKLGG